MPSDGDGGLGVGIGQRPVDFGCEVFQLLTHAVDLVAQSRRSQNLGLVPGLPELRLRLDVFDLARLLRTQGHGQELLDLRRALVVRVLELVGCGLYVLVSAMSAGT